MQREFKCLILLILLAKIFKLNSQQIPVKYEQYTVKSGLLSQTVYNAIEDNEGFLWVCTNLGLCKFDGYNFENCRTADHLRENETLDLIEDSKGRIWVIPFYGNLSFWQKNKYYNPQNTPLLRKINTGLGGVRIVENAKGNLYLLMVNRPNIVIEIDPSNQINERDYSAELAPREEIISTFISKQGSLLIVTSNGRIFNWEEKGKVYAKKDFTHCHILQAGSHDNSLFFIDAKGLNELSDTSVTCLIPANHLKETTFFRHIRKDPSGNIWISHARLNTLLYLKTATGYTQEPVNMLKGIPASVCFDRQDNVWLCSGTDGLIRIPKVALNQMSINANQLIMHENILSAYCQKNGTYWLGYENGYVSKIKEGVSTHINVNRGTRSYNRVLDLAEDLAGNIYVATDEGGARIKPFTNHVEFFKNNEAYSETGKGLFKDNNGNVIFSFAFGLGTFSEIKTNPKINPALITQRQFSHFAARNGDLYYSTSEGVKIVRNNKIVCLAEYDKRLNARINCFAETHDGTIILSTYSDGIIALKNDKITATLSVNEGLAGVLCTKMLKQNDTFYVATSNGISVFWAGNGKLKGLRNITVYEGLVSGSVNSLFIREGYLYACTPKGISVVLLKAASPQKTPPPKLSILMFSINGKNYNPDSIINLKYSNYHFQLSFVAANLSLNNEIIYRYKIRENQDSWIQTQLNRIDFSNLSPGNYHIEVQARYKNSDWSSIKAVNFVIKPPFYASWWFVSLSFLVFWLILFFIIKYIVERKYKEKLQELNMKQLLENERSRIASDLHDDIGAEVTNIMILSKLSKGRSERELFIDKLEKSANELVHKVNEVVWALNVQNDTLLDMLSYIKDFSEELLANTGIRYQINDVPGDLENKPVGAVLRRNTFLVVKECLNNVIKHSKATQVSVSIFKNEEYLHLNISDNGIGFSEGNSKKQGNGLKNMYKRMKETGGMLEIKSIPGQGTDVLIKIGL